MERIEFYDGVIYIVNFRRRNGILNKRLAGRYQYCRNHIRKFNWIIKEV